jgi:hypothetical protein
MKLTNFIAFALVLPLSCGAFPALAEDALVIAQPKKVLFVMAEGDLPENQNTGRIYLGGVYKTTIVIQKVLHGELTTKEVTVDLVATSPKDLSKAKSILVLLSPIGAGGFRAVGWDELRYIACLPRAVALKRGLEEALPIELSTSNERCTYTK